MIRRCVFIMAGAISLATAVATQGQPQLNPHAALQQAADAELAERHRFTAIRILGAIHGRRETPFSDQALVAAQSINLVPLPEIIAVVHRQAASESLMQLRDDPRLRVASFARLVSRPFPADAVSPAAVAGDDDAAFRTRVQTQLQEFSALRSQLPAHELRLLIELQVVLAEDLMAYVALARSDFEEIAARLSSTSAPLNDAAVVELRQAADRLTWGVRTLQQMLAILESIRTEAVTNAATRYPPSYAEVAVELQIAILANRLLRVPRASTQTTAGGPPGSDADDTTRAGQPYAATSIPSAGRMASAISIGSRYEELAVGTRLTGVATLRDYDATRDRGRRKMSGEELQSTTDAERKRRSGPASGARGATGASTRYVTPRR